MIGRRIAPALRAPGYQPVKKRQVMGGVPTGATTTGQYPMQEDQGGGLLGSGMGLGLLGAKNALGLLSDTSNASEGLQPWFTAGLSENPSGLAPWMTDAMQGASPISSLAPGTPATDAITGAAAGMDPTGMGVGSALNFGFGLGQGQEPWRAALGSIPFVGGLLGGLFD